MPSRNWWAILPLSIRCSSLQRKWRLIPTQVDSFTKRLSGYSVLAGNVVTAHAWLRPLMLDRGFGIYWLMRSLLRTALGFYFSRIERFHPERVPTTGPVLFTSNHP